MYVGQGNEAIFASTVPPATMEAEYVSSMQRELNFSPIKHLFLGRSTGIRLTPVTRKLSRQAPRTVFISRGVTVRNLQASQEIDSAKSESTNNGNGQEDSLRKSGTGSKTTSLANNCLLSD